ncbi:hypothetical protein PIB30_034127 [Stylosanthes scabra]|uniref:At1g61320/AtMIF1 LRR domain-containing protein n=1 Tax=Stylosanthes scabra TaxID=79078 RepID=A0ABU6TCY4_9FABA|nr:hypothetical protein [Stylosanthes scabra]
MSGYRSHEERLLDQRLTIKEFKLNLRYIIDRYQVAHHIDQWIHLAIESGVEVLELHLVGGAKDDWYNFPLCLTETKSLTKLVLRGGIRLDPAFLNHLLEFFSIKTLSLGDPPGSRTYRVKSLSLHGLQKLKGADVQGILEVYIDAPNLENLCYRAPAERDESFVLNLDSCTNLKCLSLWYLTNPNKWLLELLYKIPFLESLILHNCSICQYERLSISGPQLKFFRLLYCSNLKEVNIDAPNLLSCDYSGEAKPAISFLRNSNQPELNAYFGMDHRHLHRLREFVQNIKPQEVFHSLSLFIHEPCSFRESLGVLQASSTPPSIKHVQFSYEMLMDEKKCWCYSRHHKCCWHDLKIVKVTHI